MNTDYVRDIFNAMLGKDINNTHRNPKESLSVILKAMEMKSEYYRNLNLGSQEEFSQFLDTLFHTRRLKQNILENSDFKEVNKAVQKAKEAKTYDEALNVVADSLKGIERRDALDLAGEVVHFLRPAEFPLWNRWIWNPNKNSGSITYVLKDGVALKSRDDFLKAVNEVKEILEVFGLNTGNYYPTSVFLVYAYVRYLDYSAHLAIDKKVAGLFPTHLSTTALVLGLKPFLRVISHAHS